MRKSSYVGKTIIVYDIKPGMRGHKNGNRNCCTVIPKKEFDRLVIEPNLTRSKARDVCGINHHLYQNTIHYWYTYQEINSMKGHHNRIANVKEREEKWREVLDKMSNIFPGFKERFLESLEKDVSDVNNLLTELNDTFYEVKEFLLITKKYIRQACKRKGIPYTKFPANLSEYKVKRVLIELGYKPETQYYIKPYWYDFKILDNILIEFDGKQYHSIDSNLNKKDIKKTRKALKLGYEIIRVPYFYSNDATGMKKYLKKEIEKCLHTQR